MPTEGYEGQRHRVVPGEDGELLAAEALITSLTMFIERVESLTPTMLGISARRAMVSAEIVTAVRPGML